MPMRRVQTSPKGVFYTSITHFFAFSVTYYITDSPSLTSPLRARNDTVSRKINHFAYICSKQISGFLSSQYLQYFICVSGFLVGFSLISSRCFDMLALDKS